MLDTAVHRMKEESGYSQGTALTRQEEHHDKGLTKGTDKRD